MKAHIKYQFLLVAVVVGFGCNRWERDEVQIVELNANKRIGRTVTFTVETPSDVSVESWKWDMSQGIDGLDDQRTGDTVSYTFPCWGTHVVRVVGMTGEGKRLRGLLQYSFPPDSIAIKMSINCRNVTIGFLNKLENLQLCTVDYGDLSPLEIGSAPFTHEYPDSNATYTLRIYAGGAPDVDQLVATASVAIEIPPVARFEFGRVGTEVEFLNTSIGSISGYLWDFGDGTTSSETNPTHDFAPIDSYYVVQLIANRGDCMSGAVAFAFPIEIPHPVEAFAHPYSKTNVFRSLNTISVLPYPDRIANVAADTSRLFRFPHREYVDLMTSEPHFEWQQFDDPEHVMVVISKRRIIVHDGEIANPNDLIWAWNEDMEGGRKGYVEFGDGRDMVDGVIQYDKQEPTSLRSGQIYFWCVYGWNADLSKIAFSSKEFPFMIR